MIFVLDASAVLALLQGESGAGRVQAVLRQAVLSSVNLTEVVTKLVARGFSEDEVRAILGRVQLAVQPYDEELAIAAGVMHASTRKRGLSLGDRACLALARRLGATALTTDRVWRGIDVGASVELIR
jgi:ribonuclease VapC